MTEATANNVLEKLAGLRVELVDFAFILDRKGHVEAADVVMTISARVEELCEELLPVDVAAKTPASQSAHDRARSGLSATAVEKTAASR